MKIGVSPDARVLRSNSRPELDAGADGIAEWLVLAQSGLAERLHVQRHEPLPALVADLEVTMHDDEVLEAQLARYFDASSPPACPPPPVSSSAARVAPTSPRGALIRGPSSRGAPRRLGNRLSIRCNRHPTCLGWADVSDLGQPANGVDEGFAQWAWLEAELAPGPGVV